MKKKKNTVFFLYVKAGRTILVERNPLKRNEKLFFVSV